MFMLYKINIIDMNIPEFIAKMIILLSTYYITLEYVFTCEIQTWVGGTVIILSFIAITVLYMVFRAHKVKTCGHCNRGGVW